MRILIENEFQISIISLIDDDVHPELVSQLSNAVQSDVNEVDTETEWDDRYAKALRYPAHFTSSTSPSPSPRSDVSMSTGMTCTKDAKFYAGTENQLYIYYALRYSVILEKFIKKGVPGPADVTVHGDDEKSLLNMDLDENPSVRKKIIA